MLVHLLFKFPTKRHPFCNRAIVDHQLEWEQGALEDVEDRVDEYVDEKLVFQFGPRLWMHQTGDNECIHRNADETHDGKEEHS